MDARSELYDRAKARLTMRLIELLEHSPESPPQTASRQARTAYLQELARSITEEYHHLRLTPEDEAQFINDAINDVLGYGPLDALLNDDSVTEIMINGPHEMYVEREGRLARVESPFHDAAQLTSVIERMLSTAGHAVNESEPLCDASLPDGSRINVIIAPLALNGPVVTIRRKLRDWSMRDYVAVGALSEHAAQFLEACVKAKVNLVVSGGTSTGKTTLVTILSTCIPPQERIISIENVSELALPGRRHWIRLVARQSNVQGRGEIPLRVLVKNALRMRPDRIILGEARGGEALDVVSAMHSGHDGFITVLHANSASAALERLETLMLMSGLDLPPSACGMQIASAVNLVVHLARFADGSRKISTISQVMGVSPDGFVLEDVFRFDASGFANNGKLGGELRYTGARPKFLAKFELANVPVPKWLTAS